MELNEINTINMRDSTNICQFIDTYHNILADIVNISNKIVESGSRKYFTCEKMLKDPDMTYLILSNPTSAKAYDKRMNKCFVETTKRSNVISYACDLIGNLSQDDVYRDVAIDKLNALFGFIVDNFDAAAVYKLCDMFDLNQNISMQYLNKDIIVKCMMLCDEDGGSPLISTQRLPVNNEYLYSELRTADSLYKFILEIISKYGCSDNVKTVVTSFIVSALSSKMDAFEVAKFYDMYRDEFINWCKKIAYDENAYTVENFPLMKITDFNRLFIFIYNTLMDAGDVNSVISTYESSIEGQTDEVLLNDVKSNVDALRKMRYSMTQIFVEIFTSERLVHEVIPTVFALHVLKTRTPSNTAAYQIQMLVKALFTFSDFETQHINDHYIHYVPSEYTTDEDVLFARILSLISSFNSATSDYLSSAYSKEVAKDIEYLNKVTFSKFMDGVKDSLASLGKSDKPTSPLAIADFSVAETLKFADSLIESTNLTIKELKEAEGDSDKDDAYIPYYEDKVKELEEIKRAINYAADSYMNNANEIVRLISNFTQLNGVMDYPDIEGKYQLRYMECGHESVVDLIWPLRVLADTDEKDGDDNANDVSLSFEHNKAISGLKPGDIFKDRKVFIPKSPCK